MYSDVNLAPLFEKQRIYFNSHITLDIGWRKEQLKKLRSAIRAFTPAMEEALHADLGRDRVEALSCDIGPVLYELTETLHGLRRWARPEHHFSGLTCFPSTSTKVYHMPYGNTLIISPFNFPFTLSLGVLIPAIAGGNTAIIKTSSKTPNCTRVLDELIRSVFPEDYVCVVGGGHEVADVCLAHDFDKIFYTGSPNIGKHVLSEAAGNLTPVALELGGENGNWCIIRKDANLRDAARKIAFVKTLNSGQICININQVAVAREVADEFISELQKAFEDQIGASAHTNPEYPRLISKAAYEKCVAEADAYRDRIRFGGVGDPDSLKYDPTVIYPVDVNEPIVQHELFNPLLPVVPYADAEIDALLDTIAARHHGLALYLFTRDIAWAKGVMATQQYGGGCINEVILHMMVKGVPFNGVGHSGMGAYHGIWGFREFTHPSTVLIGKTHFNLSMREHPYHPNGSDWKYRLLHFFER